MLSISSTPWAMLGVPVKLLFGLVSLRMPLSVRLNAVPDPVIRPLTVTFLAPRA